MARKKVTDQRQKELLDAYEHCIAKYGFHQTKLEHIAQLSGIKRPAIRHFIGNRDQVRIALLQRYVDEAQKQVDDMSNIMPILSKNPTAAISSLITKAVTIKPDRVVVMSYLFVLSGSEPAIKSLVQKWFKIYTSWLSSILSNYYDEDKKTLNDVAHGIVSICITLGALSYVSTDTMHKSIAASIQRFLVGLSVKK